MNTTFSQNKIYGSVLSSIDSVAIPGVTVYFEGTSIGVSTDYDGYFEIPFKKNNTSLVISSIGYESILINSQNIVPNKTLPVIYLKEKLEALETVYIEKDSWSRSKKLKIFKQEFLGTHKAAKKCKIINEESIKLKYLKSSNTLIATATEPILIENEYLGYLLKYNLRDFEVKFKLHENGSSIPHSIHYHGYSFFKTLRDKASRRNLKNRKKSYFGSSFHFMRSLYSKKLEKNNYKIFYNKKLVPTYKYFNIRSDNNLQHVALLVNKILILYKNNKQSILISKGVFSIDSFGYHSPPESINLYGDMSKKRMSELLPLDYTP